MRHKDFTIRIPASRPTSPMYNRSNNSIVAAHESSSKDISNITAETEMGEFDDSQSGIIIIHDTSDESPKTGWHPHELNRRYKISASVEKSTSHKKSRQQNHHNSHLRPQNRLCTYGHRIRNKEDEIIRTKQSPFSNSRIRIKTHNRRFFKDTQQRYSRFIHFEAAYI